MPKRNAPAFCRLMGQPSPSQASAGSDVHYEYVMIIRPDQKEQVEEVADAYAKTITDAGGHLTRRENWGNRLLAYPIRRSSHGVYILFNFSCSRAAGGDLLAKIASREEYDENVMRTLLLRTKSSPQGPSAIMQSKKEDERETEGGGKTEDSK